MPHPADQTPSFNNTLQMEIAEADWPTFGWIDDIRQPLRLAITLGQTTVLATLFQVAGSSPRGPGSQMLFTIENQNKISASGYFSGDCIEGDVANHAYQVLSDGIPRRLHYGLGSPWIDLRLRCGGALHIFLERILPSSSSARQLLIHADARESCIWHSDGIAQKVTSKIGPLLEITEKPFSIARRYEPRRRIIVSGGDPCALAIAKLATMAQFETILLRPNGPSTPPHFEVSQYLKEEPVLALPALKMDPWTAYLGATHEDHHDLGACLHALRENAGYVGMLGAKSRATDRLSTLKSLGATPEELSRIHLSPGITQLGKSPWEVAVGIMAEIMEALNPACERA